MFRIMILITVGVFALAGRAFAAEIKMTIGDDSMTIVSCDGEDIWRMYTAVSSPGWKPSRGYQAEGGYPKKNTDGSYLLRYSLAPPEQQGVVNVTVKVSLHGDSADFWYTFEVPQPLRLNSIHVTTRFAVDPSAGKMLRLGGADITLPSGEYQKGKFILFTGSAERVTYPIPNVPIELTTDPNTRCVVHDRREWQEKDLEVRLNLLPPGEAQEVPAGTKLEKKITVRVPGLKSSSVGTE